MSDVFKVGEVVTFIGGKVYGLPNLSVEKYIEPECTCVISSIKLGDKYPYCIKSKDINRKFHGWVSSNSIYK